MGTSPAEKPALPKTIGIPYRGRMIQIAADCRRDPEDFWTPRSSKIDDDDNDGVDDYLKALSDEGVI